MSSILRYIFLFDISGEVAHVEYSRDPSCSCRGPRGCLLQVIVESVLPHNLLEDIIVALRRGVEFS